MSPYAPPPSPRVEGASPLARLVATSTRMAPAAARLGLAFIVVWQASAYGGARFDARFVVTLVLALVLALGALTRVAAPLGFLLLVADAEPRSTLLLAGALALVAVVGGGGRASVDRTLTNRLRPGG